MLYLFPNLLAEELSHPAFLPASVDAAVNQIKGLIAENEKEGRRFLRRFAFEGRSFRDIPIRLLNEHTTPQEKIELLEEIRQGGVWGLVSDCGMPCLADPGADLVLMAREKGIPVEVFSGPSSILFALVLSGLGGQRFTFHGYLPKEENALVDAFRKIEKISREENATHLFIETPYRNNQLLQKMVSTLHAKTWVCIASDLTLSSQLVQTKKVGDWRKNPLPDLNKRPTVFLLKG
jgi:16S rRNA (cytidine1402-2'-O)-methyltransferase